MADILIEDQLQPPLDMVELARSENCTNRIAELNTSHSLW